jgi:hypothetical protein
MTCCPPSLHSAPFALFPAFPAAGRALRSIPCTGAISCNDLWEVHVGKPAGRPFRRALPPYPCRAPCTSLNSLHKIAQVQGFGGSARLLGRRPPDPHEALPSTRATTAPSRRRRYPQGPSARRTAQWAVLSEDGQASACPRAYFQDYFPNARSAVGNPEAHCQKVALDAAFVCAVGARRKREEGRMRAMRTLL